jgi:hypothetical protein
MALTSTTTFDVDGNTSTITFFNPSQVDQITYNSDGITFQTAGSYTLAKSDYLLYFQYLNAFNNQLFINFPAISKNVNTAWPLILFSITETNIGVQKITYDQTSIGTTILNVNYLPSIASAGFVARGSPVTVTLQEFFMTVYMLTQYTNQVALN